MNDIFSDSFLKELENDCQFSTINQPLIDEEENQWLAIDDNTFDVEDLLNLVSPLTAAIPPPTTEISDIRSPPVQQFEIPATGLASSSVHQKPAAVEKRRAREPDTNNPSQAAGLRKTARLAAAHTSARKRRQRFSKGLKVLQDLVPNCNKSDRASIVEDAAEYIKSLQLEKGMGNGMNNMQMGMIPTMSPGFPMSPYYPYRAPFVAQASNPMWSPQVAPGLYPYHLQVRIPYPDQQFNGVYQEQNRNL